MLPENRRRHIPAEIVEQILLNLPPKSLLRFSAVSKSWRSIIFEPGFIKRYRGRPMIMISCWRGFLDDAFACPLSSIENQPIKDASPIIGPFRPFPITPYLVGSCDDLWCVKVGASLFLWNPSMNTYKRLADPSPLTRYMADFYGLGYDCVGDDYKILKFSLQKHSIHTAELYSLRKDSWSNVELLPERRNCELFPGFPIQIHDPCVFASGAFYWMDYNRDIIVYYNLTTEMYGEVMPPTMSGDGSYIGVIVLRRQLYTYLNNFKIENFILWVMEDYAVNKTWTKLFEIQSMNGTFHVPSTRYFFHTLRPLYLYDNGDILIEIASGDGYQNICLFKNRDAIPKKIVGCGICTKISQIWHSYVYVESLVSPVVWPKDVGSTFADA